MNRSFEVTFLIQVLYGYHPCILDLIFNLLFLQLSCFLKLSSTSVARLMGLGMAYLTAWRHHPALAEGYEEELVPGTLSLCCCYQPGLSLCAAVTTQAKHISCSVSLAWLPDTDTTKVWVLCRWAEPAPSGTLSALKDNLWPSLAEKLQGQGSLMYLWPYYTKLGYSTPVVAWILAGV